MARRMASQLLPLRFRKMAGVLELEVDGAIGCGRRTYCSKMVVSNDVDYLQNEFLSSREMIPASSKVDGRKSHGREIVASNDGDYLQRELAASSKMVPASSKVDVTYGRGRRGYCKEMVFTKDVDCMQHEFVSSREMVPASSKVRHDNLALSRPTRPDLRNGYEIGQNVSRRDKIHFLIKLLMDLKDTREAVYGALDAWVAWERDFPLVPLKKAMLTLEKDEQWHKVVMIIKWMLSKGQGTTMGTYGQLVRALEKDERAEEAHRIWEKKIGNDFHSAPWQLCNLMISIYYRNNMMERLVKLFKGLEDFDRKPPDKSIVQKVASAYELLGLLDEKNRILDKYNYLFCELEKKSKKSKKRAKTRKKDETQVEKADTSATKERPDGNWLSSDSE